ncbi:MAG TPA: hypothetical protein VHG93_21875 [Longimicrobium sp.]|nr:hypothetical protein [Longimicrobium sp.]
MTLTLNLPSNLERELSREAARLGLSLDEYALRVLANGRTSSSCGTASVTGTELVEYWEREGIIGSRRDIGDPVAYARELREQNQNRSHG